MNEQFKRFESIIGKEKLTGLFKKSVLIVGVGGVGGGAVEAISRSNIGSITLVDFDQISITNINRQIIATFDTVGMSKVVAYKNRIASINPDAFVEIKNLKLTPDNLDLIFDKHYDYVVDAIDDMKSKLALILYCHKNNIKIISSMGMGFKMNPGQIQVTDIFKTNYCPMARRLRKLLKDNGVKKLKCVYSPEMPIKTGFDFVGSSAFVPPVAGYMMGAEVVNDLLEDMESDTVSDSNTVLFK